MDWKTSYVYRPGARSLLPRGLNRVYKIDGRQDVCSVLMDTQTPPKPKTWEDLESQGLLSRGQWG